MKKIGLFANGYRWEYDHDPSLLANDVDSEEGAAGMGPRWRGQFSAVSLSHLSVWTLASEDTFGIDQSDWRGNPRHRLVAWNPSWSGMAGCDLDQTGRGKHSHPID